MARLDLPENQKFKRLALALNAMASGMGAQLARGLLETMWSSAYERADDFLGDAFDVTLAADWKGDPETFVRLLVAAPAGKRAGFIRLDEERGGYVIHDFEEHAPQWVKVKMAKKAAREEAGKTLSDIRREASRNSRTARAMQTAAQLPATEQQNDICLPPKNANGTGRDGTGRDLPAVPAGAPPPLALDRPVKAARIKPPARPKRTLGFTLDAALDALRAGGGVLVDPFDGNLAGRVMGALAGLQGITPADLQRASAWVGKGGDGFGVEAGELVYGRAWRGRASLVELCHPGVLAKWVAGARAELQPVDDPEAPILCPVDDPTGAPPRWLVESARPLPAKESA